MFVVNEHRCSFVNVYYMGQGRARFLRALCNYPRILLDTVGFFRGMRDIQITLNASALLPVSPRLLWVSRLNLLDVNFLLGSTTSIAVTQLNVPTNLDRKSISLPKLQRRCHHCPLWQNIINFSLRCYPGLLLLRCRNHLFVIVPILTVRRHGFDFICLQLFQ